MAEEKESGGFDPVGDVAQVLADLSTGKGGTHSGHSGHATYFQEFIDLMGEFGVSRGGLLLVFLVILTSVASYMLPSFLKISASWLLALSPLGLPAALITGMWKAWVWYVRAYNISKQKTVVLEMKFPANVVKSPRAMEAALAGFWDINGETTFIDRYWDGGIRTWYSFEIAGFEGEVHFYIWCWEKFRSRTETFIYAQYPEIELIEVEDYATKFHFDPQVTDLFANQMLLEKDPNPLGVANDIPGRAPPIMGIYPIRSYLDFEMDRDPKEEYKTDPLALIVERMSNLKKSEQAWTQIIFRAHIGKIGGTTFQAAAQAVVEELRFESATFRKHLTEEEQRTARARGTWKQTEQIQAIERHAGKRLFEVGIRIAYIAKYEDYSPPNRNSMRWLWQGYNSWYLNRLRPKRWHGDFDYPWQDFHGVRWILTIRRFLDAYRRRSYFHAPWISPGMIMCAECIASLFHPPTTAIKSPGLQRIPFTKAPPPSNLPK
ncbi:MAG: Uncharacterized protein G01um10148_863 [Parcubacteria group bacterium Gr01-1014_8]|nr:MAG: Uncharacterized protein G01um10148_863 [Parcubacteria group bacterium Gr01-1014_8]